MSFEHIEYENLRKTNSPFMEEYEREFKKILNSGWFVLGQNVEGFENEFAQFIGADRFVGLASGLDALALSLRAADLPPQSEVIVPSNTYIATILAVLQAGHKPVLVEPDLRTYNIDPGLIESALTSKTKAIMVVHLYGKSCEMDKINELCKKNNLLLIEDCAQSHGAKFDNKITGTFGDFGAFSFYPTKNLGALGDAGGLAVKDPQLTTTIRRMRNYGSDIKYYNEIVGYNSRLDEIQAAFLRVKLKKLNEINDRKRLLAKIYLNHLKSDFILPVVDPRYYDVYHIFNIRHDRRDELRNHLSARNIKTEIHYPVSPHKQKALQGLISAHDYKISQIIHETTLSLPIAYYHSESEIYRVVEALNKF